MQLTIDHDDYENNWPIYEYGPSQRLIGSLLESDLVTVINTQTHSRCMNNTYVSNETAITVMCCLGIGELMYYGSASEIPLSIVR